MLDFLDIDMPYSSFIFIEIYISVWLSELF